MDRLADWPNLLLSFRKMLGSLTIPCENPAGTGSRSAPIRLLRMIQRNESSKKYSKVEANFLYASLHIACMKEIAFPPEAYPDLPEHFAFSDL
jgi:hypothetical protein